MRLNAAMAGMRATDKKAPASATPLTGSFADSGSGIKKWHQRFNEAPESDASGSPAISTDPAAGARSPVPECGFEVAVRAMVPLVEPVPECGC